MIYRGHIKNGTVVLDLPAELPEGTPVEVTVLRPVRPPITSIDQLRSKLSDSDFGEEFEQALRRRRSEPWRTTDPFEGMNERTRLGSTTSARRSLNTPWLDSTTQPLGNGRGSWR